ncbi:MAG: ribonuclease P protein component [Candidatus Azobacteroides sp.]|nr:ribonuclease P protein component [Candidatus Azobacteroides sp.]
MTKNKIHTFEKSERLSSKIVIDKLFSHGKSFTAYPFRIIYLSVPKEISVNAPLSVLMSVSKKKFKTAVKRNRVKRLMRETYRLNKQRLILDLQQKEINVAAAFIYLDQEIKEYTFMEKKMIEALAELSKRIK